MAESDPNWEKKATAFFLFLLAIGLIFVGPYMLVRYAVTIVWPAVRLVFGLPGRLFGKTWFAETRHLIWQTNFLAMPTDDTELTRWFAAQPGVAACELRREPYWVIFDCVLRGYFFTPESLQMDSIRQAQELGYDIGGRVSIINIKE
jgi:hypothetical protein